MVQSWQSWCSLMGGGLVFTRESMFNSCGTYFLRMLSVSSAYRYYLYRGQADMRKSFDGLSGIVRNELGKDPLSGEVFIFINKRCNQLKILLWEGDGFSLFYKRLEKGTYELPSWKENTPSVEVRSDELMLILQGISLKSVRRRKRFHFNEKKPLNIAAVQ
jgi:transposase